MAHFERGGVANLTEEQLTFHLEMTDDRDAAARYPISLGIADAPAFALDLGAGQGDRPFQEHDSFKNSRGCRKRVVGHLVIICNEPVPFGGGPSGFL